MRTIDWATKSIKHRITKRYEKMVREGRRPGGEMWATLVGPEMNGAIERAVRDKTEAIQLNGTNGALSQGVAAALGLAPGFWPVS